MTPLLLQADEDSLCLQMTVDDLQLWVSGSKKSFVLTPLSSHILVFHLFVCRNTQISHKALQSMHTPSVA